MKSNDYFLVSSYCIRDQSDSTVVRALDLHAVDLASIPDNPMVLSAVRSDF